jgi:arabinoxylan arabinofuranohydrolase
LRLAGILCALVATSGDARADYPIMSHRYLADPGSLVHSGRVYLYNSNDDDNGNGYQMRSIVCVSSSDMKNWTDHGIVFRVPTDAPWAGFSWAPQPIARDGTIYLYFGNNANGVGVASSKDPAGPFKDAKGSVLVDGKTPGATGTNSWLFDPGAFIDDDGQAYLSFGGNGQNNARIIKLGNNLASVTGSAAALSPTGFFEASFLFKRKDLYYFAYSSDSSHGLRIDYMTSASPMSGYTYRGVLAGQPPVNDNNNHASEFVFKGQWYHAYHNRFVANQAKIDATYKRNLALEVLNFAADGTVEQVTYTADGVPQVGTLDPYVRVEAETMKAQSGIETEACNGGGVDVTGIDDGDWISVRGVDFGAAGAKTFRARVASTASGGAIEVRSGSPTGTRLATCSVPATGPQTWATTTCNVSGATGVVKDLYFRFAGAGFAFDSWQFTGGDGGTGGAGGSPGTGGAGAAGSGDAAPGGWGAGGENGSGGAATGGITPTGGTGTGGATGGAALDGGGTTDGPGGSVTPTGGTSGSGSGPETSGGCATVAAGDVASSMSVGIGAVMLLLVAARGRLPGGSRS